MILTTYNSEAVALLNDEPDWSTPVRIELSLPTQRRRSLTGREARRPLGDTLRLRVDWSATLDTEQLNALRDALQELEDTPLLCPVWPLKLRGDDWAADSAYTAGLLIGWNEGWGDYEISDALTPGDWDWVAPLLRGVFEQVPNPGLPSHRYGQVEFQFVEDSDAELALVPDAVTFSNGPALADATVPKVFPFPVDWRTAPKHGGAEVEIERTPIGPGRVRASSYYPQSAERPLDAALLLSSYSDIASLLRWLLDRRFSVSAHYVPSVTYVTGLAANAAAGTNTLTLTDATQLGDNRFLALLAGDTVEIVRVTNVAGNVCTLSANLVNNWTTGRTMVNLAMLARHATDTVQVEFQTPHVVSARLAWREVPAEYTPAGVETRGTTLGALTTKAWLYLVTLDWDGTTEVHRLTSFERDLTASSNTWTSRPIEHSALRHTIALDRDEITLKTRWWTDCPWRKFLPNKLDCKVRLAIYECDVAGSAGSNVTQWFGGEITGMPSADGPLLSLTAAGANALFDRPLLKLLMQPGCNDELFGPWCGLDRADWEATAEVFAIPTSKTVTLENFTFSGGTPAGFGFAHWYALGYLQRTIAGLPVRHLIFDSAAISSARIVITLGSVPDPVFTIGEELVIVPHCDNRPETCKAWHTTNNPTGKFDNYPNFAGFPFLPDKNPALEPKRKKTA